jgi:hypothetical protein
MPTEASGAAFSGTDFSESTKIPLAFFGRMGYKGEKSPGTPSQLYGAQNSVNARRTNDGAF